MIKVLFFAQVRELLDCAQLDINYAEHLNTTEALRAELANRNELWQRVLSSDKLLVAVDQEISDWQTPLQDGVEVAFFPPVTGG